MSEDDKEIALILGAFAVLIFGQRPSTAGADSRPYTPEEAAKAAKQLLEALNK